MRLSTSFILAALLGLPLAVPGGAQSAPKIAFIDSQQIFQEAPGAAAARQQLQQELSAYQQEVEQLGQQLEQAIEQFEQQQLTLSDQARQNREEELRQQQLNYQQRIQELEQQAQLRQQELVEPVMTRVNAVIEQIRREGSYTMIFDAATQGIVAADPGFDLTPEVIRRLREQDGSGTPQTSDTSGSTDPNR